MDQQQGQVNHTLKELSVKRDDLSSKIRMNGIDKNAFKVGQQTLGQISSTAEVLCNQNKNFFDADSLSNDLQMRVNASYVSLQDAINTINQQQQQQQAAGRRRGTKRRGTKRRGTKRRGTKRRRSSRK